MGLTKLQATSCKSSTTSQKAIKTTPAEPKPTKTPQFLQSCDKGWTNFNGHCYLIGLEDKTWDDACVFCKSMDSYLMEITSNAEFEFASELVQSTGFRSIWIGAKGRDIKGRFVYQYSKQPVPERYWAGGQPSSRHGGGIHCVVMSRLFGDAAFYDTVCNLKGYFVCENHKHPLR